MQVARRLVGEQQRRLGDDGARDGHELLLSARELRRIEILLADDAEAIERVGDLGLALRRRHVAIRERHFQVLGDGELVEQVEALEDDADVLAAERDALLVAHLVDRLVEEAELAPPVVVEHGQHGEQRRLAGARRSHDGDEVAGLHLEVDGVEDAAGAGEGSRQLAAVESWSSPQSARSASMGSTRVARRAGITMAMTATAPSTTAMAA